MLVWYLVQFEWVPLKQRRCKERLLGVGCHLVCVIVLKASQEHSIPEC